MFINVVETKPSQGQSSKGIWYKMEVTDETGTKQSCFADGPRDPVMLIQPGDRIEIEVVPNGKWKNFKLIGHPTDQHGSYKAPQRPQNDSGQPKQGQEVQTTAQALAEVTIELKRADEIFDRANDLLQKIVNKETGTMGEDQF